MHGWGKAADLSTSAARSRSVPRLRVHEATRRVVGWNHPAFAEPGGSSCPEPWHWEWVGDGGNLHRGPKRGDAVGLLPSADDGLRAWSPGSGRSPARFVPRVAGRPPIPLQWVIVGATTTPNRRGYWMVGADGGIFSFGDAKFHGSLGGKRLNAPINGMASTPLRQGLLARRVGRRDLHVRRREVPRLDRRDAPQPAGRRHDASRRAAAATGSLRPTAGSSRSATPSSAARPATCASSHRSSGWRRRRRPGLLAGRVRRRRVHVRRRALLRVPRRAAVPVAGHRLVPTKTGKGYRLALADRRSRVRRRPPRRDAPVRGRVGVAHAAGSTGVHATGLACAGSSAFRMCGR